MRRLLDGPCADSASRSRCRGRATAASPRGASSPGSKKAEGHGLRASALAPFRRRRDLRRGRSPAGTEADLAPRLGPAWRAPAGSDSSGYEWLWVFAAAHPLTGCVFWLVLPHLSAEMMQLFLDEFAAAHAPRASASWWL